MRETIQISLLGDDDEPVVPRGTASATETRPRRRTSTGIIAANRRDYSREYQRLRRLDPEYRAKDTAATLKKYHSDPEFREQRLAQMASDRRRAKAKGTTVEHIQQLRKEQGGCCAICGVKLAKRVDYRHRECLDHDHKTGVVRGILCHYCNVAIGYLEDDPERVRAAADYLERAAARTPSHTF